MDLRLPDRVLDGPGADVCPGPDHDPADGLQEAVPPRGLCPPGRRARPGDAGQVLLPALQPPADGGGGPARQSGVAEILEGDPLRGRRPAGPGSPDPPPGSRDAGGLSGTRGHAPDPLPDRQRGTALRPAAPAGRPDRGAERLGRGHRPGHLRGRRGSGLFPVVHGPPGPDVDQHRGRPVELRPDRPGPGPAGQLCLGPGHPAGLLCRRAPLVPRSAGPAGLAPRAPPGLLGPGWLPGGHGPVHGPVAIDDPALPGADPAPGPGPGVPLGGALEGHLRDLPGPATGDRRPADPVVASAGGGVPALGTAGDDGPDMPVPPAAHRHDPRSDGPGLHRGSLQLHRGRFGRRLRSEAPGFA